MANTMGEVYFERGQVKAVQNTLLRLLEKRFGQLPEDLTRQIEKADDFTRLQDAILQAARVSKLDEFSL